MLTPKTTIPTIVATMISKVEIMLALPAETVLRPVEYNKYAKAVDKTDNPKKYALLEG